ncbi:MAG TPA: hypothetical protein VG755_38525, partial [Nannocystaceae bacterium]|nr:hypothetical protein [Nannocystaceae bacterium]
ACSVAQRRFEQGYNAQRRTEVRAALSEADAPDAILTARVSDRLDAFANSWHAASTATCEDRDHPAFDTRLACLHGRRAELESLLDALVRLDADGAAAALDASERLTEPWSCLETAQPRVEPESASIASLRWAIELGEFDAALELADEALRALEPERDREALAEALWARGIARVNLGQLDDGLADVEAAHHLAVAQQDAELAAESADVLAFNFAMRRSDLSAARAWLRTAESWIARGATRLRSTDLAVTAAAIDDADDDRTSAVDRLRRALAEESCEDCSAKRSVLEALAATTAGGEGVRYAQQRFDLVTLRYGPHSPNAVEAGVALAGTLYNAGRNDDAIAEAERTRLAALQLTSFDPLKLASLLDTLGKAHMAKHDVTSAVARLEEAVAIVRAPGDTDSRFGMIVRYDLARAYVDAGDPRAIVLLQEVVAAIESDFGTETSELAVVLSTLAQAQLRHGQRDAALTTLDRADAIAAAHPERDVDVRGAGVRDKLQRLRAQACGDTPCPDVTTRLRGSSRR